MAISDYSTIPSENTTISGINIAEGCPPSGINNAIRQMMADIKAKAEGMTKLSDFTDDLGSSPTHTHSQYALINPGIWEEEE